MFQASPRPLSHVDVVERIAAADLGDNTRGEMSRGMLLMFKAMLELLRWQNRQQKGIKPRFQFGSVLLKTAVSVPISITVTTLHFAHII